jgi:hypothetical protein
MASQHAFSKVVSAIVILGPPGFVQRKRSATGAGLPCGCPMICAKMAIMNTRFGRQLSPPLSTISNSGSSVHSMPSIREYPIWPDEAAMSPDALEEANPEHYPDWFEWINIDGAYTMVPHGDAQDVLSPGPTAGLLMPMSRPKRAKHAATPRHEITPAMRQQRVLKHSNERRALRSLKLCDSAMGRIILELASYPWYRMPNGLTAMQFRPGESIWRSNDCANNINWFKSGAYAHRSTNLNLLAVVNIERLAPHFEAAGYPFFLISAAPAGWPVMLPIITHQRAPRFLHDTFTSPRADQAPATTADERQNGGQAAYRRPQA